MGAQLALSAEALLGTNGPASLRAISKKCRKVAVVRVCDCALFSGEPEKRDEMYCAKGSISERTAERASSHYSNWQ